jgi:uncharacterized protein YxeA
MAAKSVSIPAPVWGVNSGLPYPNKQPIFLKSFMNLPTKKAIVISILIFVVLVVVSVLFLKKVSVFADLAGNNQTICQDNFYLQLTGEAQKVHFGLKSIPISSKKNRFELTIYQSLFKKQTLELKGFERYASLEKYQSFQGKNYLFFTGDVGAHSNNLFAVEVVGRNMTQVHFEKNGETTETLVSDLPLFTFSSSATLDITNFNRDYEKDPLQNYLLDHYQLQGGNFVFINTTPGLANENNQPDVQTGGIK